MSLQPPIWYFIVTRDRTVYLRGCLASLMRAHVRYLSHHPFRVVVVDDSVRRSNRLRNCAITRAGIWQQCPIYLGMAQQKEILSRVQQPRAAAAAQLCGIGEAGWNLHRARNLSWL